MYKYTIYKHQNLRWQKYYIILQEFLPNMNIYMISEIVQYDYERDV